MTQTEDALNQLFKDFKEKIRKMEISQQEAAERLSITRSHLNKVINKRTTPSLKLIQDMENFCYGK
jgi:transcriptional regulator with XRE-family HTH domain